MNEFEKLRRQLLQRLVEGEINRDEYEWTLSEIERHQSEVDTAPARGQTDTQVDAQPVGAIQPGMVLGSHTVMRILGKGGMGEVWLASEAVHVSLFYSVIKLLPAVRDEAKKTLAIFHKVRLLQHEHICPVYSLGHDERVGYYFVMKYIEGITLTQRAEDPQRPLSHSYLLEVLSGVARALDYAHQRGIVHRDVKPSNIMLNGDLNEIHIVDFGLAAHAMADGSTITGTPKYMAPEQWTTERQDGRTDQFALGVVAYEMLSGDVPFAGVDSGSGFGIDQVGRKVMSEKIPPISDVKSNVNNALSKSMSHSKEERFGSCTEFVEQLAQALVNPRK